MARQSRWHSVLYVLLVVPAVLLSFVVMAALDWNGVLGLIGSLIVAMIVVAGVYSLFSMVGLIEPLSMKEFWKSKGRD